MNVPFFLCSKKKKTTEHKPNSVALRIEPTFIYLRQADYSDPVPPLECDIPDTLWTSSPVPYIVLHRIGFSMPDGIAPSAVVSYTSFSPLPLAWRYIFCCTFHASTFAIDAPPFQAEFCSMVFGLSSRKRVASECLLRSFQGESFAQ